MQEKFKKESAITTNPKWNNMISRENELYKRENEIRTEFERDYTRIIHSNAYRRLKHKTQVFYSPVNDHICTRIEHVNYVESISCTISKYLGLNVELTRAIAAAHDLGHAPFGHKGEQILSELSKKEIGIEFWHEKNGENLVKNIEVLEDEEGNKQNLNLTYAVRDGIISHCGEIDENSLKPRKEYIDLNKYTKPNEYAPYTWEACVVKISDKISYIFRDIEDAIQLKILNEKNIIELKEILKKHGKEKMNNTVIIHELISDLCKNSTIEKGLTFSKENYELLNAIKKFNYKNIYLSKIIEPSGRYFKLVINEIYNTLKNTYKGKNTKKELEKIKILYPKLIEEFINWIENYWDIRTTKDKKIKNKIIYKIENNQKEYLKAIIDYISGMTDNYAIKIYEEIISY